MKIMLPIVLCGFIISGFFAVCLAVFLAPSDSYIMEQLSPAESTTTSVAATTQVYAILITETTTVTEDVIISTEAAEEVET